MLSSQIEPRDTRPTVEWLRENVCTYPPLSIHGPFDVSRSRHFIEPFNALDDERTREVNVLAPPRSGKSLIGDGWQVSVIKRFPGPFLAIHQTDPDAKMMHFSRVMKMLEGSDQTRDLLPRGKYKWEEFELLNGEWLYTGGPSLSNLSSKPARYIRMEEVWMWEQGRMAEAEARAGDYQKLENSKILRSSQGGPKPLRSINEDEWFRTYNRGTNHEWESACIYCGKFYDPIFSGKREDGTFWGIQWDQHKLENGDWDIAKCLPTVRFECPHCGKPAIDSPRIKAEWNRMGRYRQVGEGDRKRVSFHWESVIDFPWDELVGLWLDAENAFNRGNIQPKLQFFQKRRAMFRDEAAILRGSLHLKRIPYEVRGDWPDELARFLTIDKQQEGVYWWTVRAWSEKCSRRLGFGKAFGESELVDIQARFKVPPSWVLIDSAYEPKGDKGVYAMCVRHGWIAVKGDKAFEFIHTLRNGQRVRRSYAEADWGDPECIINGKRAKAPFQRFSKVQMNQAVKEMIDAGRWEEPIQGESAEMEEEYNKQMAGRVRIFDEEKKVVRWLESKNDHARDLANAQVLAAIIGGILSDPAQEQMSERERASAN
jgi:hypothetical protein